jgi:hypothetical protein
MITPVVNCFRLESTHLDLPIHKHGEEPVAEGGDYDANISVIVLIILTLDFEQTP